MATERSDTARGPRPASPRPTKLVRLRYMDGFACLASECPDTCCGWWTVAVDQSHYNKLGRAMNKEPAGRAALERGVRLVEPSQRTRDRFALLVLDESSGNCTFLRDDKLCAIHAERGEELLPDACATYPKVFSQIGRRLELSGDPSCPEVARRLLANDEAIVVDDAPLGAYPRIVPSQEMAELVSDPYWGMIDRVRGALYRVFSRKDYSTAHKFHFALYFAGRVDPLLRPSDPDEPFSLDRLEQEIDFLDRDDVLAELGGRLNAATGGSVTGAAFLAELLAHIASGPMAPPVRRLFDAVLATYEGHGLTRGADGRFVVAPDALFAHFAERRAAFEPPIKERLEAHLRNYLAHLMLQEWYPYSPTLPLYLQNVMLRVAMLRFLLLGHPQLARAAGDPAALDALAVEVLYVMSRAFAQNTPVFAQAIARLVQVMPDLERSVELMKL